LADGSYAAIHGDSLARFHQEEGGSFNPTIQDERDASASDPLKNLGGGDEAERPLKK